MKLRVNIFIIVSLVASAICLRAQDPRQANEDSLRAVLVTDIPDTTRVNILLRLAQSYFYKQADTCLLYATGALDSSRKLNYHLGIIRSLLQAGEANRHLGNYIDALKMHFEALELSRKLDTAHFEAIGNGFIGLNYYALNDYDEALVYLKKAIDQRKKLGLHVSQVLFTINLARVYTATDRPDSAFYFLREAGILLQNLHLPHQIMSRAHALGDAYASVNMPDSANYYYRFALKVLKNPAEAPNAISGAAAKYSAGLERQGQLDSALYYARYSYRVAKQKKLNARILDAGTLLSSLHRKDGNPDSALYYKDIVSAINSGVISSEKFRELQSQFLQEQKRNQEIQQAEERRQNNTLLIGLLTITIIILVASILLFRSNRTKQEANLALHKTLADLRSAQSQLIQSEKMASLGELTAGIAHEIQNPLNFVNNFAELNKELIAEMEAAIQHGNLDDAKGIARNIADNQEKINQHGKRADGIVKSMLQHSRISSGQKELTDLNGLCDEYLRLAYHGYRAKDKSFNAKVQTNFDPTIPKVNIVPQDIGRVLLNLINNAFYAVNESTNLKSGKDEKYEPMVTLSTKSLGNKIEVIVNDNGPGIPEKVKEKIFQPFFTTKPTGQGSGLGLSLSYDIVKAHGGTLEVNSPPAGRAGKEGLGSKFIIQLPT
jgi:two-component system NtrC family sensor kinase